ncbi:hypothetical protein [Tessaracoccus sp. G1721]
MFGILALAVLIFMSVVAPLDGGAISMPVATVTVTATPGVAPSSAGATEPPGVEEGFDEHGNYVGHPFGSQVELAVDELVTVDAPEEFTPSEYADVAGGYDAYVRVKVTVENRGSEPLSTADLYFSATTGNRAASEIYDIDQSIGDPFVMVMPGRSLEYYLGFAIYTDGPLSVTVEDLMAETYTVFADR